MLAHLVVTVSAWRASQLQTVYNLEFWRYYRSLAKECPLTEHLTSLPMRRVGAFFKCFRMWPWKECSLALTVTHSPQIRWSIERIITYNRATSCESSSLDGTQHSEWKHATMSEMKLASLAALASSHKTTLLIVTSFSKVQQKVTHLR